VAPFDADELAVDDEGEADDEGAADPPEDAPQAVSAVANATPPIS
jgi:hypothetical protein